MNEDALRARWIMLWQHVSPTESLDWIGAVFERLYFTYAQSGRAYHDEKHIGYCLGMAKAYRALADDPEALEMAIWFHDAIYHVHQRSKDLPSNEALSAQYADDILARSKASLRFRERVTGLILATLHTPETAQTNDQKLIADIDWSPIGWSWKSFQGSRVKVRCEYGHISDEEFCTGRRKWLLSALERKSQFHLPVFKQKFEERALYNLRKELGLVIA